MRLKKIIIIGFKSFADKVTIEFSPGTTAIVGPNGCGKSNIVDAFRWVLGEQSAKSLRGGKMEDVIFAGTSRRSPLNFAEISLTLTDVEGEIPLDFSEIEVTRRVYRSGDSEYFINRRPVRKKDVDSLFLDSGIGKSSFSIFEQGKIEQIIMLGPVERRAIFEEAAGITRFLQRKKEAFHKLEQTEINLSRALDICSEVTNQIAILEKQAEKALSFAEDKKQLDLFERSYILVEWLSLAAKKEELLKREQEEKKAAERLSEEKNHLEVLYQQERERAFLEEKKAEERKEVLFASRGQKELKKQQLKMERERLSEGEKKIESLREELDGLKMAEEEREEKRAQLLEESEKESGLVQEAQEVKESAQKELVGLQELLEALRMTQQENNRKKYAYLQAENVTFSECQRKMVRLEHGKAVLEEGRKRQHSRLAQIQEIHERITRSEGDLATAREKCIKISFEREDLLRKKEGDEADIALLKKQWEELRQESMDLGARHKVLLRLQMEMEGFSKGTKALVQAGNDAKSSLYQKVRCLYALIIPKKGAAKALSSVMQNYTETLLVDTKEDLKALLAYAEERKITDFSVLCLEDLRVKKSPTPLAKESEMASHFLEKLAVVKGVDAAYSAWKEGAGGVWLEEGLFLDPMGVLFCSGTSETSTFFREAETLEIEEKQGLNKKEIQIVEEKLLHAKNALFAKEMEIREMDKNLRKEEMILLEIESGLKGLKLDEKRVQQELSQAEQNEKKHHEEIAGLQGEVEYLEKKLLEEKQKAVEMEALCHESDEKMEKHSALWKEAQGVALEKARLFEQKKGVLQTLNHQLHLLAEQERQNKLQKEKNQKLQASLMEKNQQMIWELEVLEKELECLDIELGKAEEHFAKSREVIGALKQKLFVSEQEVQKKREEQNRHDLCLVELQMQIKEALTSQMSLQEQVQDRFGTDIESLKTLSLPVQMPKTQLQRQIGVYRRKVEESGPINMTSIEEFAVVKERRGFLEAQIQDLQKAKEGLFGIIKELDTESRTLFEATMKRVRENFQRNFKILFKGGDADLEFTDSEDILESGIEIIARPPEKKMRVITALSGGEKCMTAMALLFSLFEVKAAPFCILDEIDAPLDDANVGRFLEVVKEHQEKSQFIIITHNKKTMCAADSLIGVTMEERGVSKLLHVTLQKEEVVEPGLVG